MNKDEAISIVQPHLTKARFDHTLRVATTAEKLAGVYHEPIEKVKLAAVFHDYAKYRSLDEMKRWITHSSLPKDLLYFHDELWHGPVASILVEREYGIMDRSIQSAIRYHTTGRANMSKLDMIIFLADYIEPGRDFPGVDAVRAMAEKDLIHATWMALQNTIQFLVSKHASVYPDTFYAYNDFRSRINGGN